PEGWRYRSEGQSPHRAARQRIRPDRAGRSVETDLNCRPIGRIAAGGSGGLKQSLRAGSHIVTRLGVEESWRSAGVSRSASQLATRASSERLPTRKNALSAIRTESAPAHSIESRGPGPSAGRLPTAPGCCRPSNTLLRTW